MLTILSICRSALIALLISTTLASIWLDSKDIKVSQIVLIVILLFSDLL